MKTSYRTFALLLSLPFLVLWVWAFQGSPQHENPFQQWGFTTSQTDPNQIGYFSVPDGEDISIRSISLWGEHAILVDSYFSNLKKVNLKTGEMTVSQQIGNGTTLETGLWLRESVVLGDYVYVCALDSIFQFNEALELTARFATPRGTKRVWKKDEEQVWIYLSSEQKEDLTIESQFMIIQKSGEMMPETMWYKSDAIHEQRVQSRTNGLVYQWEDEKKQLHTPYGNYPLEREIPFISEYDAINVDFSKDVVVFFSMEPEELRLYVQDVSPEKGE